MAAVFVLGAGVRLAETLRDGHEPNRLNIDSHYAATEGVPRHPGQGRT